jgi:DNA (cytosine-5)-methyltransferase 1
VRFVELFAGIGGMGYGLMRARMECVGYVEIDKHAHKAFQILHDPNKTMWDGWDVRDVTDDDIRRVGRERGPIQLLAGGFPCQAFSVAGKRQGFADSTRGTLFFEIIRFASILRPSYILLENVTGLLNHDNGRTFETIIRSLDELGYVGQWIVLNSKDFGVPQNRERVFIVGHLRNKPRPEILSIGGKNPKTINVVGKIEQDDWNDFMKRVHGENGLSPTVLTHETPKVFIDLSIKNPKMTETARCLKAKYDVGLSNRAAENSGIFEPIAVSSLDREEKRQNGRRFKDAGDPMFTLTAQDRHGVMNDFRIRKLTPLECLRLQSYPDEWYHKLKEQGISDFQLYKMAGNGVTSNVAYEIGLKIKEAIE